MRANRALWSADELPEQWPTITGSGHIGLLPDVEAAQGICVADVPRSLSRGTCMPADLGE
jgi:hypothetical protein